MARRFAEGTSVPVDRTRSEIERLVRTNGATSFMFGEADGRTMIVFDMKARRLRFVMPMPQSTPKLRMSESQIAAETRRRWRALLLVLKAKLEAVASGIVAFDEEFLAHIVVAGSETVGDRIVPDLQRHLEAGRLPPLLQLGPGSAT